MELHLFRIIHTGDELTDELSKQTDEFIHEWNQCILPYPHLNCNSSLNQKSGFCGRIHTIVVWEFVDELIRLWCGWAFKVSDENCYP